MNSNKQKNLPYKLIVNLFYPAILGSIFYTCLKVFSHPILFVKSSSTNLWAILIAFAIILFLVFDYLDTIKVSNYSWLTFWLDILILVSIYVAFSSLNDFTKEIDHFLLPISFGIISFIFIIYDLVDKELPRYITVINGIFFLLFVLMGIFSKIFSSHLIIIDWISLILIAFSILKLWILWRKRNST